MELTTDMGGGRGWVCSAESITNISSEDQGCIPQRQGHKSWEIQGQEGDSHPWGYGNQEVERAEGLARRRGLPNPL